MTRYYRYGVEVIDGGRRIRVNARDPSGETIHEPGGECALSEISPRISQLVDKVRRGSARPAEMDELGEALFEALFPTEVIVRLRSLLAEVRREDGTLRLELDLDEAELPQVAALPWEFLRAPQTPGWPVDNLGTHPWVVLSRRRRLSEAADPIALTEPLRIQMVVSAPKDEDLGEVAYEEVEATLQQLARDHPDQIAPPLEVLHQPNATDLDRALEEHKPHILHFVGHGRLHKVRGIEFGELALVGPAGLADWLSDEEVGELFQVHSPEVVFLQACESGAEGSAGAFVGVASQVVQRNVSVVMAMQYPVRNAVAVAFAEEFYRRLGRFEPVDRAVQMGRRVLSQRFRDTRDWAAPVLFVRVRDGRLFVPPEKPAEAPAEASGEQEKPPAPVHPFPKDFFASDILLDLSHNQTGSHDQKGWDPFPSINVGYTRIKGIATGMGCNIEERDTVGLLTSDFQRAGALLLVCPKHVPLTKKEINNVRTYVRSGGCLLALGFYCEPHHKTNFSELMKFFGISFNPDVLLPPGSRSIDGRWQSYGIRPEYIVRVNTDVMPSPDPLLENVKSIGLLSSSSLEITEKKSMSVVLSVVLHSGQEQLIWEPDPEGIEYDADGYWDFMAAYNPSQEKERPIIAKAVVEQGKVVAIGTWKVFHDYFIDNPEFDNGQLFRNILTWFKE